MFSDTFFTPQFNLENVFTRWAERAGTLSRASHEHAEMGPPRRGVDSPAKPRKRPAGVKTAASFPWLKFQQAALAVDTDIEQHRVTLNINYFCQFLSGALSSTSQCVCVCAYTCVCTLVCPLVLGLHSNRVA